MYTLEQLETGLSNATKAGDQAAIDEISGFISNMQLDKLGVLDTPTSEEQGGFFSGLSRGISQGTDASQLAYSSSLEGLGKVTGSEGLQQYGSEGIAENEEELAASGELSNFRDVDDISSGATFYGETLGQMLPQTAISLGALWVKSRAAKRIYRARNKN